MQSKAIIYAWVLMRIIKRERLSSGLKTSVGSREGFVASQGGDWLNVEVAAGKVLSILVSVF